MGSAPRKSVWDLSLRLCACLLVFNIQDPENDLKVPDTARSLNLRECDKDKEGMTELPYAILSSSKERQDLNVSKRIRSKLSLGECRLEVTFLSNRRIALAWGLNQG